MASEVDGWIGEPTRIKHCAVIAKKQKKIKENVKRYPKQCDRIEMFLKSTGSVWEARFPDDVTLLTDIIKKIINC